jgi:AcrR family transcriptional regulator
MTHRGWWWWRRCSTAGHRRRIDQGQAPLLATGKAPATTKRRASLGIVFRRSPPFVAVHRRRMAGQPFGSKEALLNAARIEAIGDWWQEFGRTLAANADPDTGPMERFEAIWTRVVESFATQRPLWVASFELLAQIDESREVRAAAADAQQQARQGLASLFQHLDPTVDKKTAWRVGSLYLPLLPGVMAQWLIDPEHAPSARDLAEALQTILADLGRD